MMKTILGMILLASLLGSALAVIHSKYQSRGLFIEIQRLERELDDYEIEWGQLQLEQTTLAEHSRIERLAYEKLGLIMPTRDQTIFIKP